MNIFKARSLRWTLHNEGRPEDKTRYIVVSKDPIGVHDAISCLNRWARSNVMFESSTSDDILIDYSKWSASEAN